VTTEPLSDAALQILLALADGPRHGLGIAAEVETRTDGRTELGASTLYTALKRMLADGWLREADAPPGQEDPRRRFYALTASGSRALAREIRRLEAAVRDAHGKNIAVGEASA
jgi:DNA-binding PadR family transcriptional regulator